MPGYLSCPTGKLPPGLRAAAELLRPDCAEERAAEIIGECPGLLAACLQEKVAPLVQDRWGALLSACLRPDETERWNSACMKLLVRSARQQAAAKGFLAALAARSVPVIVLRGLWISRACYARPELRGHTDVDVIVPTECARAVSEVMQAEGFERRDGQDPVDPDSTAHRLSQGQWSGLGTWAKIPPGGPDICADFHATLRIVSGGCWPWRPTPELLYERADPWEFEGIPLLALKPHMALLTQCTHIVRHALGQVADDALIMYHDIALLGPHLGEEGWRVLLDDARELRIGLHAWAVLACVSDLWGDAFPAEVSAALMPSGVRCAIASAALGRPRWLGHRGRMAAVQSCGLHSMRDVANYVWRNLPGTSP